MAEGTKRLSAPQTRTTLRVVEKGEIALTELGDVASAVAKVDQSYSYGSVAAHSSQTSGSEYADKPDFCAPGRTDDDPPMATPPRLLPEAERIVGVE